MGVEIYCVDELMVVDYMCFFSKFLLEGVWVVVVKRKRIICYFWFCKFMWDFVRFMFFGVREVWSLNKRRKLGKKLMISVILWLGGELWGVVKFVFLGFGVCFWKFGFCSCIFWEGLFLGEWWGLFRVWLFGWVMREWVVLGDFCFFIFECWEVGNLLVGKGEVLYLVVRWCWDFYWLVFLELDIIILFGLMVWVCWVCWVCWCFNEF